MLGIYVFPVGYRIFCRWQGRVLVQTIRNIPVFQLFKYIILTRFHSAKIRIFALW